MDELRSWWHVIMGALLGIIWLSRLEWRTMSNERELWRLWEQRKEDLERAAEERRQTQVVLNEIRGDIKLLLKNGGGKE